jgi:hypothetical protein
MGRFFEFLSEKIYDFNDWVVKTWRKFVNWVASWWNPFVSFFIIKGYE